MAVDRVEQLEYRNPEAMRRYFSHARDLTVGPDQKEKIELELLKVGD